jgi:hypothetical protein
MALLALRQRRLQGHGPDRVNATLAAPLGGANKLLSGRNGPDNCANCGVIYKSIDHAKKSEIHRTVRLVGCFAWLIVNRLDLGDDVAADTDD